MRRVLLTAASRGSLRSPKFPGEPRREHAPHFDPGPVTHNRFSVRHFCLPPRPRRRLPGDMRNFGALSRSLFTRCVRFAPRVFPRNATLASSWEPPFAGQDLDLSGSLRKVSDSGRAFAISSSFPFPWPLGARPKSAPAPKLAGAARGAAQREETRVCETQMQPRGRWLATAPSTKHVFDPRAMSARGRGACVSNATHSDADRERS